MGFVVELPGSEAKQAHCEQDNALTTEPVVDSSNESTSNPKQPGLEFPCTGSTFDLTSDALLSSSFQAGPAGMAAAAGMILIKNRAAVLNTVDAYAKGFPDVIATVKDGFIHLWKKADGGGRDKFIGVVSASGKRQTVFERIRAALERWDNRKLLSKGGAEE